MTKGERIKQRRELLNISQTDLAKSVGIAKQTLYKYENDIITNIPSDVIEKLSAKLDCEPSYIMGWEEPGVSTTEVNQAMDLYKKYKSAIPEIQAAVESLLKSKPDS